jgi:hypothetical protein
MVQVQHGETRVRVLSAAGRKSEIICEKLGEYYVEHKRRLGWENIGERERHSRGPKAPKTALGRARDAVSP